MSLYTEIDETIASNTDFIQTGVSPSNAVYVCRLSDMTDPVSSSGHTVRYRYRKDATAGDQIDLTVQLIEGYTNEGSPGTTVHEEAHTDIGGTGWTQGSFTLDATEADSITDYTDLFLRFVANAPSPTSEDTITYNSSATWTPDPGVTEATVECWGTGGLGGDGAAAVAGGGGGGGCYARTDNLSITEPSYSVTINATGGGYTTFNDGTTDLVAAQDGHDASGQFAGAAGSGATYGTTAHEGGIGQNGDSSTGGGGGSSGGSAANGDPGGPTQGDGGDAPTGGGDGGDGGDSTPSNGVTGTAPGGGGGGGGSDGASGGIGGPRGEGQVTITWNTAARRCMVSWAQMEVPGV